jgi:hypothetical protein
VLAGLTGTSMARAADTTETWEAGAVSFELYVTKERLDYGWQRGELGADTLLGYGLAERLSVYFQAELAHPIGSSTLEAMPHLGVFGGALDTDHLDLDLLLDFAVDREDVDALPGIELNLDSHAERRGGGVYVRGGLPLSGHMILRRGRQHSGEPDAPSVVELTLGAYLALSEGVQLLLEHDGHIGLPASARRLHSTGSAFGTNLLLTESCELLTQLYVDSDASSLALTTGLIVSMPAD